MPTVDVETIGFDGRVIREARRWMGFELTEAGIEARLRQELADDLASTGLPEPTGRLIELRGARGTWTLRGDGRVVHRFCLRPDEDIPGAAGRIGPPAPLGFAQSDLGMLEREPKMILEILDPQSAQMDWRAVAAAAAMLNLDDAGSDDVVDVLRALLALDLEQRPDVTAALGRVTLHGRRAVWGIRASDLCIVTIDLHARARAGINELHPLAGSAEQSKAEGGVDGLELPNTNPIGETASDPFDEGEAESTAVGDFGGAGMKQPAAEVGSSSDWVSQIERLAHLKERGLLSDQEFAMAKAKLLT